MNNDSISRSALKKAVEELKRPKAYSEADVRQNVVIDCVLHIINNATTVNKCENCDLYFKATTKEIDRWYKKKDQKGGAE